jgi:hypothetical protein
MLTVYENSHRIKEIKTLLAGHDPDHALGFARPSDFKA